MFLCGVLHLALHLVSKFLYLYFMHDTYLLRAAPWTHYNTRPALLQQVVLFAYALWWVLDINKKYGLAINALGLCLYGLALSVRYMQPLFASRTVLLSTVVLETARLWVVLLCIALEVLAVRLDALATATATLLGAALCWLGVRAIDERIRRNLQKGRDTLGKESEFELFLQSVIGLTEKEPPHTKHTQLVLYGLLQTHMSACKDAVKCPCHEAQNPEKSSVENAGKVIQGQNNELPSEGEEEENNGWSNPFFKKRKMLKHGEGKPFKVGMGGLAALGKTMRLRLIADAFIAKFETIKSKRATRGGDVYLAAARLQSFSSRVDSSTWQEECQAEAALYLVAIVKHWIKARLAQNDVALST
jgi:hypothetical protein